MMTNNSPLMGMLEEQMRYTAQRQGVLAHNIANADTPQYKARDLKAPDFAKLAHGAATGEAPQFRAASQMRQTNPKHLTGTLAADTGFRTMEIRDAAEISPTKNNVNLDEQMAKVSETGANNQIANSLDKKFTGMYRTALGTR